MSGFSVPLSEIVNRLGLDKVYTFKDFVIRTYPDGDIDRVSSIELRDAGKPFNPLDNPDPDITLGAEERQIGGLGIFLCKKMMDEVSYRYTDGCNVLTMKKHIK